MNIMLLLGDRRTRESACVCPSGRGGGISHAVSRRAVTLSLIGRHRILLGLVGSWAMAYFAEWRVLVSSQSILDRLRLRGRRRIFFGFYPARKAAGLEPHRSLEGYESIHALAVALGLLLTGRGRPARGPDLHAPVLLGLTRVATAEKAGGWRVLIFGDVGELHQFDGRARGDPRGGPGPERPRREPRPLLRHRDGALARERPFEVRLLASGTGAAISRADRVVPVPERPGDETRGEQGRAASGRLAPGSNHGRADPVGSWPGRGLARVSSGGEHGQGKQEAQQRGRIPGCPRRSVGRAAVEVTGRAGSRPSWRPWRAPREDAGPPAVRLERALEILFGAYAGSGARLLGAAARGMGPRSAGQAVPPEARLAARAAPALAPGRPGGRGGARHLRSGLDAGAVAAVIVGAAEGCLLQAAIQGGAVSPAELFRALFALTLRGA